jgi:hypothetical protein
MSIVVELQRAFGVGDADRDRHEERGVQVQLGPMRPTKAISNKLYAALSAARRGLVVFSG